MAKKVLIMGAAGRDFHVFNTCYREDPTHQVVAFTATQIPGIDARTYPAVMSGPLYPEGIPILPERDLEKIIGEHWVTEVVFAYSDVSYDYIAKVSRRVEATGASFNLFDADKTMIRSKKPVVAVCAVRTGCGKSSVSRYIVSTLRDMGLRVAALRHPMPYGNLSDQVVQRFETIADLERHNCTIEEMEEYEPHIQAGNLIFAGADYARILAAAEKEADVILWDGGNNDTAFIKPDLYVNLLDPLRPGHEMDYFPGRWNVERADVQVMTKIDEARPVDIEAVRENALKLNPDAPVIEGHSPIELADPSLVEGKRVVVIEDGPTVTHGGMGYGAGFLAAQRAGAAEIVDPRPFVEGEIASAFEVYPHLDKVLPALGYGERQLADLENTINSIDCDAVVIGTPIDLARILKITKPTVRVTYSFKESEGGKLTKMVQDKFGK